MPLTQVPLNMLDPTAGGLSYRNKIINGCGWIDQRNNNNPVTVNSTANTFGTAFTPTLNGAIDKFSWDSTGLTNWNGWGGTGTWAANAEL
jgi:hypothetical protein